MGCRRRGDVGGDLVKMLLRTIDRGVPVRMVHASRGKLVRAKNRSAPSMSRGAFITLVKASVERVDLRNSRGLDRGVFLELAELGFLRRAGNVIITGATGLEKIAKAELLLLDDWGLA